MKEGRCARMPRYEQIQTLAYQIDPAGLDGLALWRLRVPQAWKQAVTNLASARRGGDFASAPVYSLNHVMHYLFPDQLLTSHPGAWKREGDTLWLTAVEPISPPWLARWEEQRQFLDQHPYWYSLLPHVAAMFLARTQVLQWHGEALRLRRVGGQYNVGKLVSWEPESTRRGDPWSLRLRFKLETFADLAPRLHLHVGVARWVKSLRPDKDGQLFIGKGTRQTLYLARNKPLRVTVGERPNRCRAPFCGNLHRFGI